MRTVTKYFEELLVFYSKSVSASSEEKPSADGFVYFLRSENCVHNFSRGFVTVRTVAQNSEASRGKARKRKPRPRKGTRTRPRKCPRTGCDDDAAGDDDVHARQQPPHDYRSSALCDSYFSARSDEEEEENVDNPRVEKDAAILTGQVPEYGIRYPASADACGRWDWAPLSQTSAPCFYLFPEETVDSPPCRFSEDRYQFI